VKKKVHPLKPPFVATSGSNEQTGKGMLCCPICAEACHKEFGHSVGQVIGNPATKWQDNAWCHCGERGPESECECYKTGAERDEIKAAKEAAEEAERLEEKRRRQEEEERLKRLAEAEEAERLANEEAMARLARQAEEARRANELR